MDTRTSVKVPTCNEIRTDTTPTFLWVTKILKHTYIYIYMCNSKIEYDQQTKFKNTLS